MWRHPRSHTLVEASSSSCTFAMLLSKWQWDRQVPASGPSMVCGQHTPLFPLNLHILDFPATRCFTSRVSVRSAFILIVLDSQQHGMPLSDEHCKNGILSTRLGRVGLLLSLHFCSCISEAQAYCAFQEAARSQRQEQWEPLGVVVSPTLSQQAWHSYMPLLLDLSWPRIFGSSSLWDVLSLHKQSDTAWGHLDICSSWYGLWNFQPQVPANI